MTAQHLEDCASRFNEALLDIECPRVPGQSGTGQAGHAEYRAELHLARTAQFLNIPVGFERACARFPIPCAGGWGCRGVGWGGAAISQLGLACMAA